MYSKEGKENILTAAAGLDLNFKIPHHHIHAKSTFGKVILAVGNEDRSTQWAE